MSSDPLTVVLAVLLALVLAGYGLLLWLLLRHDNEKVAQAWEATVPSSVRCETTACPYPGIDLVQSTSDGVTTSWRCKGCSDEGNAMGWWIVLPPPHLQALPGWVDLRADAPTLEQLAEEWERSRMTHRWTVLDGPEATP